MEILENVYALSSDKATEREAGRALMLFMEMNVRDGNIAVVRTLFESVDVSKLSMHAIGGLVRSSYRYKQQVPKWQETYEACWKEVRKRGRDPKTLFIGLHDLSYIE